MNTDNCKACGSQLEKAETLATEIDQALDATELGLLKFQYTQGSPDDLACLYGQLRPLADRFLVRVLGVCSIRCKQALASVVAAMFAIMFSGCTRMMMESRTPPAPQPLPADAPLISEGASTEVKNCEVVFGKDSPETVKCFMRVRERYLARMSLHYRYANATEVELQCKAYPEQCSTLQAVELVIRESDAQGRLALNQQREQAIDQAVADHRRRAVGVALVNAGNNLQNQAATANCRSTVIGGGTVLTNCN